MHFIDYILLFGLAFLSGILYLFIKPQANILKLVLTFSGAYLFCLTAIHLLPELYSDGNPLKTGIFIVVGFVLQIILEVFSEGIEHGHIHVHENSHQHRESSAILVLFALCIHAFLEGGLLAHPRTVTHHHDSNTLLWGIVLHKAPEAFALMSVLLCDVKSKTRAFLFLLIFSLASPFGLFLSNYLLANEWMSSQAFTFFFAVVSGNFLHISTTIVFESSLDHKFNAKKMGVAILAAAVAVGTELFA